MASIAQATEARNDITVAFQAGRYTITTRNGQSVVRSIGSNNAESVIRALQNTTRQAAHKGYRLSVSTDGSNEANHIVQVCGDLIAREAAR